MSVSDRTDPLAPTEPRPAAGGADVLSYAPRGPKNKQYTYFWRSAGAIWPYRRIVMISVACAFFVGLAVSGGLTTMLPILRVLLNNQTVPQWVDSQLAERRLGVRLADSNTEVRVIKVNAGEPAAAVGLRNGDRLTLPGNESATATLAALADPARDAATVSIDRAPAQPVTLRLPALPRYLAVGRHIAGYISTHPVVAIAQIFGILATLAVVSNVVKFFQEYLSDKAAVLAVNDIRRRLYDHILHVPMSHLSRRGTSDMMSRLVQDATNLEMGFKTVLGQSIQEPIKAAIAFGLALLVSWKLTIAIVIFAPAMAAIIRKFGKKMRRASRAALQKSSTMLGQIEATLSGIRVVKGASAERMERRRYRTIMSSLVVEQLKMSKIDAFSAPTLETMTLLVVGGVVLIASYMVLVSQTLSATSFFLIMACLGTIGDSLRRVNKVNNTLQRSNAAAQRIYEILDLPIERQRRPAGGPGIDSTGAASNGDSPAEAPPAKRVKLPPLRREIRFDRVTFAYPGSSTPAITEVSLTVPKGRCVAVVGRNGSGKTTLLALLPRLYDPQGGRVLIDDTDIRYATLRSLRGQISVVTQDSVIFPGTIAQNIAYGNPRATRQQIIDAAERAFAHEFIEQKPQGYDTLLGELGGSLSGGQKQRLCIARAVLRNAPILVLDEATSQVDAESEHLIHQAIDGLMHRPSPAAGAADLGPPTMFVIAHRFSTITGADVIVVMDQGRIVGQGRHDELLETCETYRQLYERQLFKAPEPAVEAVASMEPAVVGPT